MSLALTVREDLQTLIGDNPLAFTHKGVEYTGTLGGLSRRSPLEIGGFEPTPELTMVVNVKNSVGDELFTTRPKAGDRITVRSVTYRIERTEIDSFEECLEMELRSEYK